jgi:hypothetical protein
MLWQGTVRTHAKLIVFVIAVTLFSLCAGVLADETRIMELSLKEGRVIHEHDTFRVNEGDRVEIRITADENGVLHLHGYDVEIHLRAGETVAATLEAKFAGRFPITRHAGQGGHRAIAYLEVYPR